MGPYTIPLPFAPRTLYSTYVCCLYCPQRFERLMPTSTFLLQRRKAVVLPRSRDFSCRLDHPQNLHEVDTRLCFGMDLLGVYCGL